MTREEAQQIGLDAGDLSMHRAGRKVWNDEDSEVAKKAFQKASRGQLVTPPNVEPFLTVDTVNEQPTPDEAYAQLTFDSPTQIPDPTPDPPVGFGGGDSGGGGASGDF